MDFMDKEWLWAVLLILSESGDIDAVQRCLELHPEILEEIESEAANANHIDEGAAWDQLKEKLIDNGDWADQ